MKIKTNNVPADCDYLTNGKKYELIGYAQFGGSIVPDDGEIDFILFKECEHLDGESWEVVSE